MGANGILSDPTLRIFAQIMAIVLVSRLLSPWARRLGQPSVIAEIVAGIVLGPSLLGWLWPDASHLLFPAGSLETLQLFGQVGLVLFMFLVGLQLDPKVSTERMTASVVVAIGSVVVPFGLGLGSAWWLYPRLADPTVPFGSFATFVGLAMSITAFPVLARILSERRLLGSPVGDTAMAAAAMSRVLAWCALAFLVPLVTSGATSGLVTTVLSAAYVLLLLGVVRPLLARVAESVPTAEGPTQEIVAGVLLLVMASAWVTELVGIDALFGGFLLGVAMPKGSELARSLAGKIEDVVLLLLLPLAFAYSGLRTELTLLDAPTDWAICAALVGVATFGKLAGAGLAARITGSTWREAGAIAVLMNARGLMGLVVLNIGLDADVISRELFTMLTVVALVTTVLTTPLLAWVHREPRPAEAVLGGEPAPRGSTGFRMLVCVASGRSGPGLASLAAALNGPRSTDSVDALHLLAPTERVSVALGAERPATPEAEAGLQPLLDRARSLSLEVRPTSFVSASPASDICRVARVKRADLLLLGWHRPIVSQTLLGGVVYEVMKEASATVAVLVDRGFGEIRSVLVPFSGSAHDRAALSLAQRLASRAGALVTVLSIGPDAAVQVGRAVADAFGEMASKVRMRSLDGGSPVEVVIEESRRGYELVVIGVGDAWGLAQRQIGLYPERLILECPISLLVVRGAVEIVNPRTVPATVSA